MKAKNKEYVPAIFVQAGVREIEKAISYCLYGKNKDIFVILILENFKDLGYIRSLDDN